VRREPARGDQRKVRSGNSGSLEQDERMKLPPVVSVVGHSGVGKTVFLEKLIAELKGRGFRIGTIKHHPHDFEIDQPGKDSWRHARAGSDIVVLSSPGKVAVVKQLDAEMDIDEIVEAYLADVELVLTEGYKTGPKKKIEVSRRDKGRALVSRPDDLIAIVADQVVDVDVPHFDLDDVAGIADLLELRYLARHAPAFGELGEVLISADEIQGRVQELGAEISRDYAGLQPRLIGILKGVTLFLADLMRAITEPVTTDYMAISKYDPDLEDRSPVRLLKDLDRSITGQHVLLVEDIIDSGLTMEYILGHLENRRPASLRVCTLFNKTAHRAVELPLDYIGFDLPDLFVVGYGLDHGERYRNLPYLGVLRSGPNVG
jgi:hypoxanthine phosphoribosyltransferase